MQIVVRTFTIWVLAALVNAIVSTGCLLFGNHIIEHWTVTITLAFICTLLFSVPSLVVFFIVFVTIQKQDGEALFRRLLGTGWILAIISGAFFYITFHNDFKEATVFLALSIFVATTASILLHHRFIVAICNPPVAASDSQPFFVNKKEKDETSLV